MPKKRIWLIACLTVLGAACLGAVLLQPGADPPGASRLTQQHDGQARSWLIQAPKKDGKLKPVILLLHPAASNARTVWTQTSLPKLARERSIILAAPDGLNGTWNTYYWQKVGPDDLGFLIKVIQDALTRHGGDPDRVYVTGMSAGAGMAFALAWEHGDLLAAIAPVANNLGREQMNQKWKPKAPIPLLHIMGTADQSIPYNGGNVFNNPSLWPVSSAEETLSYWAKANRAGPPGPVEKLADKDQQDGTTVERTVRPALPGGAEAVHYRIVGGGHTWPNGPRSVIGEALLGKTNRDIDSGEVIVEFFLRHRRARP